MQCNIHPSVIDTRSPSASGLVASPNAGDAGATANGPFVPLAPESLDDAGIAYGQMESLILKHVFQERSATGRQIAAQLALPFGILEAQLHRLKEELLVVFKAGAVLGDYVYELSPSGADRARRHLQQCAYVGAAPVPLDVYHASVEAQSVRRQKPKLNDVRRALADLIVGDDLLCQLGEAVNAGLGFFLFGAPGNGKTSIAERITKAYGETIWIPRAVDAFGETIQLYDPHNHRAMPTGDGSGVTDTRAIDRRWVCIERPVIVGGGELTLDSLEITRNPATGISEAPLQMKSNCGTLVIDDFGRQRVSLSEMINRWIVPLERRHDYLHTAAGRKLQVPFDQLVIFSSNLDPATLVDEAFLRRVPYKIEVKDPTERQYRRLLRQVAAEMGIACYGEVVDYLMEKTSGRCRRFCHPQALLRQIGNYCDFRELPNVATKAAVDAAVKNHFVAAC